MAAIDHQTPAEPVRRTYAIGDIHGRYDLFRRLMHRVHLDQATRAPATTQIVILGNIVDCGPESARLVRGCMDLTAATDRFVVLKGNHEDMMAEALGGNLAVYSHWLDSGGRETLSSWDVGAEISSGWATQKNMRASSEAIGQDVINWLASLPLYHRNDDYLFVHAGIRPGIPLNQQQPDDLLWINDDFLEDDRPHGMMVVHGHCIDENGPVVRSNRIGIDTGAYRTGRLTALGIEGDTAWALDTAMANTAVAQDYPIHAVPVDTAGGNS